jgi:hypothetical protein
MADKGAGWGAGVSSGPAAFEQDELHEGLTPEPATASGGEDPRSALRGLLSDLVGAAQAAAEGWLDEHKRVASDQLGGLADGVRRLGRSIDQTQSRVVAHYAEQAAAQVEGVAAGMRTRDWGEIAADAEDFARRRPTLFILGALTGGLVLGSVLAAAAERHRRRTSASAAPAPVAPAPVGADIEVARVEEVF